MVTSRFADSCRRAFKPGQILASKAGLGILGREVEEKLRFQVVGGRVAEDGKIAVWVLAVDEASAGGGGAPPVCMVYLTDLDGSFPAKEPEYPVLWCVPPGVNANRNVPLGEIVAVK